jgi:chloramphenicol-sensitive protein RarD
MNKGVIYAFTSYLLWGFFPLYFHALGNVPAVQVTAHRVVWSFLFLILVLVIRKDWAGLRKMFTLRTVLIYLGAGTLLACNWLTYVYATGQGMVLETSLGYFINPLVSVLLGVVFLREKLRPAQWGAVGLAFISVTYLTVTHGSLPWIALVLAFSFGLYGLVKKVAPLGSFHGLTLETAVLLLPALIFLSVLQIDGSGVYGRMSGTTTLLLSLTGVVTAIPLLLFADGARRVPLSMIGLLQYVSPTIQFLLGVFVFGEVFTWQRLVGFSVIWIALIIYSADGLLFYRKSEILRRSAPPAATAPAD